MRSRGHWGHVHQNSRAGERTVPPRHCLHSRCARAVESSHMTQVTLLSLTEWLNKFTGNPIGNCSALAVDIGCSRCITCHGTVTVIPTLPHTLTACHKSQHQAAQQAQVQDFGDCTCELLQPLHCLRGIRTRSQAPAASHTLLSANI